MLFLLRSFCPTKTVLQNMLNKPFLSCSFCPMNLGGNCGHQTHMEELMTERGQKKQSIANNPLRDTMSVVSCARADFVQKTFIILDGSGNMLADRSEVSISECG